MSSEATVRCTQPPLAHAHPRKIARNLHARSGHRHARVSASAARERPHACTRCHARAYRSGGRGQARCTARHRSCSLGGAQGSTMTTGNADAPSAVISPARAAEAAVSTSAQATPTPIGSTQGASGSEGEAEPPECSVPASAASASTAQNAASASTAQDAASAPPSTAPNAAAAATPTQTQSAEQLPHPSRTARAAGASLMCVSLHHLHPAAPPLPARAMWLLLPPRTPSGGGCRRIGLAAGRPPAPRAAAGRPPP